MKNLFFIFIITLVLIGCSGNKTTKVGSTTKRIDTPEGMIDYLNGQRLPALESTSYWENKYGTGLKLTTAHYEIYTTLLEPLMLRQVPGFMESAYRAYNKQLTEPVETTKKFKTYIFADRQQWEDFTDDFAGPQAPVYKKIKAGAYYLKGSCVAYNIGRERTFSVLGHEGWHQFNKRYFKYRLPSWLDEGIAMQFETSRYDRGMFYFEPSRNFQRLGALKLSLIENKMIPLEQLIALNPGEVLTTEEPDDAVRAFYAQAYALIRFLREDDYSKRLTQYHQLLIDGLEGEWPLGPEAKKIAVDRNIPLTVRWNRIVGSQLFELYISEDLNEIEQEYYNYCRKIVYRVRVKRRRSS
ncbi:MAG: hypothetical protein ACYTFM_05495 [Planctomycetota bacterium]|jgi:hypothetical protein